MVTTRTVHFTFDFDGLTKIVRDFWAEHSFDRALDVLESCNISLENGYAIIRGKKKMAQEPNGKKGIDGCIVPDNWKPNLDACQHGVYPDPKELPKLAASGITKSHKLKELEDMLKDEAIKQEQIEQEAELLEERKKFIDTFIEQQNPDKPYPKPTTDYKKFNNAWILPNGKFYGLESSMRHIWAATAIADLREDEAELKGWVKLSFSGITSFGYSIYNKKPATQKQINTLFDWSKDDVQRERAYYDWLKLLNPEE